MIEQAQAQVDALTARLTALRADGESSAEADEIEAELAAINRRLADYREGCARLVEEAVAA